jgi:outer membrane protein assembly factor BamB
MEYKIELNKIIDIEEGMDAQPSFPILIDQNLILGINQGFPNPNDGRSKSGYLLSFNLNQNIVNWLIKIEDEENNAIQTQIRELDGLLYVATYGALYAINSRDGITKWKKKFKSPFFPKISILNKRLIVSNWGELIEFDIESQKKLNSKKPRVKWFDSEVVECNGRWFVSTSNSKILEVNPSDFEIKNEFKFPGGWATGVAPLIYNDNLISSNYGGKIIIVDLDSNEISKRINKKSGSKPQQLLLDDRIFFYDGNLGELLTAYDLPKFSKKWSKEIKRVQFITQSIDGELEIIFKDNDKFVSGIFDKSKGDLKEITLSTDYEKWDLVPFDLWDGVGIIRNDKYSIYAFEPNNVTIKAHNNI